MRFTDAISTGVTLVGLGAATMWILGGCEGTYHAAERSRRAVADFVQPKTTTHDKDMRLEKSIRDESDPKRWIAILSYEGNPDQPYAGRRVVVEVRDTQYKIDRKIEQCTPASGHAIYVTRRSPTESEALDGQRVSSDVYNGERRWFVNGADLIDCRSYVVTKDLPKKPETKRFVPGQKL